ncbi:P-loop ATPase, Sll1717 family [Selenomonas sputigena]|uniref:P-loop ATPase, Sll1717 family n=1 Tax=Selenomonas sputigena TaxID=69823 RepID=UPI0022324545|nr:hypothetical protein [Selenomonas sputigena]UZD42472.1 hypothetical protein OL240_07945 [Selenomonas sputigena]
MKKLGDIYFGHTDAKNELLGYDERKKADFETTFLKPANLKINSFQSGKKYYIYGLKGTGKTALLRYIDIQLRKDQCNETSFILFKSDFSENDKQCLGRQAAMVSTVDYNQIRGLKQEQNNDFELVWRWFFLNRILTCMEEKNICFFRNDNEWMKFRSHMDDLRTSDKQSIFPKIKRGMVAIRAKFPPFGFGEVSAEIERESDNQKVKFSSFIHTAEEYFEKLHIDTNKRLYLLLDELELGHINKKKEYDRDVKIIRDLIIVANKLNSLFREKKFPFYIIVSVRSEVLSAVSSTGKEINKCIEDFGALISWHQYGGDEKEHPLIKLIVKRLLLAENLEETPHNIKTVWSGYFPDEHVQNQSVERYILHNSWYRPRDIIRFLNLAKDMFPDHDSFSHNVFDGIRKTYSERSWTECLEELMVHYTQNELEIIEDGFTGWKRSFSMDLFAKRIRDIEKGGSVNLDIRRVLSILYNVGVIGNKYIDENFRRYKFRFNFRGDKKILHDKDMMVHNALYPYFSL